MWAVNRTFTKIKQLMLILSVLLYLPAHIWKLQRKRLSAAFNNQITLSFLPIFNEKANLFIRNLGQHNDKSHLDIMHYSSACVLDMVCGKNEESFSSYFLAFY